MALLLMRFIKGHLGKLSKSTMLIEFSNLSHGFELLEDNIHD
jgi:hypothetical protein